MKKIVKAFLFVCLMLPFAGAYSNCPTGVSSVQSSWWGPSNSTYYTMCGCQVLKGYSGSGGCGAAVIEQL